MNLPCQSNGGTIPLDGNLFYPSNVLCRMYKKSDAFVEHTITKNDSRDQFVEAMRTIGDAEGHTPVLHVDYHYFKKRGTKDQTTFERSSQSMKTAVVAYSSDWIERVIIGSNALSMEALELVLSREMEYVEPPKDDAS